MPLDDWQDVVLEAALGERSTGKWASKFVGLSAPRQNGKSQLIVARALAGVLLFGEKMIIISANETDTAREVWKRLLDVIEDNPTLNSRVTGRMDAINREFIAFGRGSQKQTIKLKARSKTGSRGFSADCLLLDEGQILGKHAWGAILPTMSARASVTLGGPQLWLFGTPPTEDDDPFAFSRVRESAQAGKARHCWIEWSALPSDDFDDETVWAKANPSYGVRVTRDEVADERANMDDDQFARERLGIWDISSLTEAEPAVPNWQTMRRPATSQIVGPIAVGVDVSPDRRFSSVAIAGLTEEGMIQLEVVASGAGVAWVPGVLTELVLAHDPLSVVIDRGSAAASFQTTLAAEGIEPEMTSTAELGQACGAFYDDADAAVLVHLGDPLLDAAVRDAGTRRLGDAWAWNRRGKAQITPLVAVTLARHGFVKNYRPRKGGGGTPRRERAASRQTATKTDDLATAGF